MKRTCPLLLALVLSVCSGSATAQQKVAPPPKPADEGPSLAVTMQFIQAKLNEQGKVNYAAYWHNNANNTDGVNQMSAEISNVVADPAACRIAYHWKSLRDGTTMSDQDIWFSLRAVQELVVRTGEQNQKKVNTDGGQPAVDARIDPPVFVLVARRSGNVEYFVYFFDENLANRVAKAMVHAVELCGGGNKDPF